MGDTEIFVGGAFITLWLVSFFSYSAISLRKGYQPKSLIAVLEPGLPARSAAEPVGRPIVSPPVHDSLSTH